MTRLTSAQVREMRLFAEAGFSIEQIAEHYRISVDYAKKLLSRERRPDTFEEEL